MAERGEFPTELNVHRLPEILVGWAGNYEFIDAESSTRHPHRVDSALLKRYVTTYHRHFELWKERSRKFDVLLSKVPGDTDFLEALRAEAMGAGAVGTWK